MKKTVLSLLLVFTMVLSLALTGCGQSEEKSSEGGEQANSTNEQTKDKDSNEANASSEETTNLNASGLPIVNDTVTLKVAGFSRETIKKPFDELQVMMDIEEATNVSIDWDVTPKASWKERKNLILSSGEWPDVFFGAYIIEDEEIMSLAADGILMPIEGLIEDYAPNIQAIFDEYPEVKDYITAPDGHIYSLPTINAYQSPAPGAQFINKKWLDEAGLDIPTTTDEFYEVLKAFKARGNEDEYPMSFRFENGAMGINGMFGAFGVADNVKKMTILDGQVTFTPMTEAYKDGVAFFHKLVDEGLVDIESFSQDNSVYKSKIKNGQVGMFNMWSLSSVFGAAYPESDYVFMPPLTGPNGDQGHFVKESPYMNGKGSFLVTSTCENPEVAIRWADYMADPDVSFQLSQGPFEETYTKNADDKWEQLPMPEGVSQNEFRHNNTPGAHSFHMISHTYLEGVVSSPAIAEKQSYDAVYLETASNKMMPPIFLSPEDAQRSSEIGADIGPYVKEMTSKWIVNGGVEDEWDGFIEQLKKMNVEEFLEISQNRYDELYK